MKIIKQENKHLRTIICDCCDSVIEYNINEINYHSSDEDGFGGNIILTSIDCPNCKHRIIR